MKKIISYLIILFLTSCTSVGKFGAGVDITFDPRTIGMQIDDTIMQKNLSARLALANKKYLSMFSFFASFKKITNTSFTNCRMFRAISYIFDIMPTSLTFIILTGADLNF